MVGRGWVVGSGGGRVGAAWWQTATSMWVPVRRRGAGEPGVGSFQRWGFCQRVASLPVLQGLKIAKELSEIGLQRFVDKR